MKRYLFVMIALLLLAIVATAVVFMLVLTMSQNDSMVVVPDAAEETTVFTEKASHRTDDNVSGATTTTTASEIQDSVGIPLRDVPLNDGQRAVFDFVGVDINTFVITPAMQACAEEVLGATRVVEIMGGAAPTTGETLRLVPCIAAS